MLCRMSRSVSIAVVFVGLSAVLALQCTMAYSTDTAADATPVIRSAKSGPWSAPKTWQGEKVPAAGDRVLILTEHVVTYDAAGDDVIRAINIAGKLAFARDKDTRLNVGLIKIEATDEFSEEGFDCDAHLGEPDPNVARATLAHAIAQCHRP